MVEDIQNVPNEVLFNEVKRRFECSFRPRQNVVLIGAPGSGKGTAAPNLRDTNCWCHLSTGDMLREAVQKGTSWGQQAKEAMEAGKLVSDEIVIGIIKDNINQPRCERGIIMDGFPRNIAQAHAFEKMMNENNRKIDAAIHFDVQDEVLLERVCGRRIHQTSGRTYHVKFMPPKVEGKDDVTGEPLIQRKDDNEETLKKRLQQYNAWTVPVLEYFKNKGVLKAVDAGKKPKEVLEQVTQALNQQSQHFQSNIQIFFELNQVYLSLQLYQKQTYQTNSQNFKQQILYPYILGETAILIDLQLLKVK